MARRAFGSSTFSKTPRAPKVGRSASYRPSRVLSPKQFSYRGSGFQSMTRIGSMSITSTKRGTRISSGSAGMRYSGGRMTSRRTIG